MVAIEGSGRGRQGSVARDTQPLSVFISYSRAQVQFADEMDVFLSDKGFRVLIDRHSIAKGEDFTSRLRDMILKCDTVVFILSDESSASEICAWEVAEAKRLGKRMLVVTQGPLSNGVQPPTDLSGIDWVFCWRNPKAPGSSQTTGFVELAAALVMDIGWLRQRTELQEDAHRWYARGGDAESPILLQGELLAEALNWTRAVPAGEDVPADVTSFLQASTQAEENKKAVANANLAAREQALDAARKASQRVRTVGLSGAFIASVLLVAALATGWFALRGIADTAEVRSDLMAREAKGVFDAGQGNLTASLLLSLQADPMAQRSAVGRYFSGKTGYPFAMARMMAAQIGNRMGRRLAGHEGLVRSVDWSPDGAMLATASWDHTVRVWDTATGDMHLVLEGQESSVASVDWSPDGARLATGSTDNILRIWNSADGSLLRSIPFDTSDADPRYFNIGVTVVAWSPDGERLAAGNKNGLVRIFDIDGGGEPTTLESCDGCDDVASLAWRPDGQQIAAGHDYGGAGLARISIWQPDSTELLDTLTFEGRTVTAVGWSNDGFSTRRFAAASADGTDRGFIKVWLGSNFQELLTLPQLDYQVTSLAWHPHNNRRFLIGTSDGSAILWDAGEGEQVDAFTGHAAGVHAVAWSPDGKRVATGSDDQTARLWRTRSIDEVATLSGHQQNAMSVTWLDGGKRLATVDRGNALRVWDAETHTLLDLEEYSPRVGIWSPDERFIATQSGGRAVIVDANTGEEMLTLIGHDDDLTSVAWSPNGARLATTSEDKTARIWDAATGEALARLAFDDGIPATSAWSPNGAALLVGSWDGRLTLWDPETGLEIRQFGDGESIVTSVGWSPDGTRVVAGARDGVARLWDVKTGERLRTLRGHADTLNSTTWSPDGRFVLTGSRDATAKIWDAATGELVARLTSHAREVLSTDWSPDGRYLATASRDATVKLWAVPPILLAERAEQIRIACETLVEASAPLKFTREDVQRFSLLEGEPVDEDDGAFLSPCRDILLHDAGPALPSDTDVSTTPDL